MKGPEGRPDPSRLGRALVDTGSWILPGQDSQEGRGCGSVPPTKVRPLTSATQAPPKIYVPERSNPCFLFSNQKGSHCQTLPWTRSEPTVSILSILCKEIRAFSLQPANRLRPQKWVFPTCSVSHPAQSPGPPGHPSAPGLSRKASVSSDKGGLQWTQSVS